MDRAADVFLVVDEEEIPFEALVDAVYSRMTAPVERQDESNLEVYAVGTKAGYMFLHKMANDFPEIKALLTLQPAISMHFASMMVAGMMTKKALDSDENNIEIKIVIEEGDSEDASQSRNSDDTEEGC